MLRPRKTDFPIKTVFRPQVRRVMAEHWGVLSVKDDIQQKDNGIYGSEENEFQPR